MIPGIVSSMPIHIPALFHFVNYLIKMLQLYDFFLNFLLNYVSLDKLLLGASNFS